MYICTLKQGGRSLISCLITKQNKKHSGGSLKLKNKIMETNFKNIASIKEINARKTALTAYIAHKQDVPALYVGTYAKYNTGDLAGAWINLQACEDKETFLAVCRALHGDEEYPELMFQDFQGFPEELYSECGGVDNLYTYIEALENCDTPEALAAFLEHFELDDLCEFDDRFIGPFDSEVDFSYDYVDNRDLLKDAGVLASYFNYEAYARDLFINNYVFINGFVFFKGSLK